MGKIKSELNAVKTEVEAIAHKLIDNPIDTAIRERIADAVTNCGIPLNARAAEALVSRIVEAMETHVDHARIVATHFLGLDNHGDKTGA